MPLQVYSGLAADMVKKAGHDKLLQEADPTVERYRSTRDHRGGISAFTIIFSPRSLAVRSTIYFTVSQQ